MFIFHDLFRKELSLALSASILKTYQFEYSWEKIYPLLGATPNKEAGDIAFPLFLIAKEAKSNPALAAKTLDEGMTDLPDFVSKKLAMGPYLNFFFDFEKIAKKLIPSIIDGTHFKQQLTQNAPKTMIEYSQPNTHKELHVGHMRNLCYGILLQEIWE